MDRDLFKTIFPLHVPDPGRTAKLLLAILLIFFVLPSAAYCALNEQPVLNNMDGNVSIKGLNSSSWEPAMTGMNLEFGDSIMTGVRSRAEITSEFGTFRLYENTILVIPNVNKEVEKRFWKLLLKTGAGIFNVDTGSTGGQFNVATNHIVVGIKQARFTVTADADSSSVAAHIGKLELAGRDTTRESVREITKGWMVTVKRSPPNRKGPGTLTIGPKEKFDAEEAWEQWDVESSPALKRIETINLK